MTSSPSCILPNSFQARKTKVNASNPFATPIAYLAPQNCAKFFSKLLSSSPIRYQPELMTREQTSNNSFSYLALIDLRSKKLIIIISEQIIVECLMKIIKSLIRTIALTKIKKSNRTILAYFQEVIIIPRSEEHTSE